jgi:signal transduction histidine kinase/CheY-like chemotaxis protein
MPHPLPPDHGCSALLSDAEQVAGLGSFQLIPPDNQFHCSGGLYRLLGLEPGSGELTLETFLGRFVHPDDRARLGEQWPAALECRIVRVDGQVRHVQGWTRLIPDEDGKQVRFLGVFQDVTEAKQAEEQRRLFAERLHEARKLDALGVLAGGVAHDFNNLLTTVLGYADLTEWQLPAGSPLRGYMQQIAQAARRAAGLCQQLLAYAGKTLLSLETLDLARLVRDAEPALRGLLVGRQRLVLDLPESLEGVRGDPGLLRQVLLELVGNAIEALGEGPGEVAVRLRTRQLTAQDLAGMRRGRDCLPGEYAQLEVADTGQGMDDATRARIFEPFFTTKFPGRGLGLAAVGGLVRAHRGILEVDSALGQGTTFHLFLPIALQPGPNLVVVLDDEPGARLLLTHLLENAGFQVVQTLPGPEGLALLERIAATVRLVLVGLDTRRADRAFLDQLRRRWPALPLIVVGNQRALGLGDLDAGFLDRPFGMGELLERVREALAAGRPPG